MARMWCALILGDNCPGLECCDDAGAEDAEEKLRTLWKAESYKCKPVRGYIK
jgi:hypothetical protein